MLSQRSARQEMHHCVRKGGGAGLQACNACENYVKRHVFNASKRNWAGIRRPSLGAWCRK
ncbi:hypothetical protein FQK02_16075 [Xanthomonas vasicola]|nr:hypothetical protein FQK02_16075 [Xanthomonas vasicola]